MTGGSDHHAEITVDQSKMQAVLDELDAGHRDAARWRARSPSATGAQCRSRARTGVVVERGADPGHPRAPVPARRLAEDPHRGRGSPRSPTRRCDRAMTEFGRPAMSAPVTLVLGGQRGGRAAAAVRQGALDGGRGRRARAEGGRRAAARGPRPGDAHGGSRARGRPDRGAARASRAWSRPRSVWRSIPRRSRSEFADVAVRQGAERRLELEGKATQPAFTTEGRRGAQGDRAGQPVHHELPVRRVPQRQPDQGGRADRRHPARGRGRPSASTTSSGSGPRRTASPRATSSPTASSRRTSAAASPRSRRRRSTRCSSPVSRTSSTSRTRSTSTATRRAARRPWRGRPST